MEACRQPAMTEPQGVIFLMNDHLTVFQPVQERRINFRGHEIATADLKDGHGYVSVRSFSEAFGLDQRAQRRRLQRKKGFFEPFTATILMTTAGGPQPTLCLDAFAFPSFLVGIDLERVQNEEARTTLEAFQLECAAVLAEHFGISERGEINFLRESINRMVAEQEIFEDLISKKVDEELASIRKVHEEKIQEIREAFGNLRQQVKKLDVIAGPKTRLTPEQLGQLRISVATLGALLQEQGVPKPYPAIYMDITRLTGVSRSEDIRQEDFQSVMTFLENQVKILSSAKSKKA
jgi:hypothetical protein